MGHWSQRFQLVIAISHEHTNAQTQQQETMNTDNRGTKSASISILSGILFSFCIYFSAI